MTWKPIDDEGLAEARKLVEKQFGYDPLVTGLIARLDAAEARVKRLEFEQESRTKRSAELEARLRYFEDALCLNQRLALPNVEDAQLAIEPERIVSVLKDRDALRSEMSAVKSELDAYRIAAARRAKR